MRMMTSVRLALAGVIAAMAALLACSNETVQTSAPLAVVVQTTVVTPVSRTLARTYTGSLEGIRQAVLRARLAEPVESVYVREGDTVAADQVVLTLDRDGPSSQYAQTRSLYLNAEKRYRKMKYLYEQGAVSEIDFDAARTEYEVRKAAFESVKRLVEVRTPIAGLVTSVRVRPGYQVVLGQELATVAETDSLRVRFGVDDDEVGYFIEGSAVTVTSPATGAEVEGRVVAVARAADPLTRTFEVEAVFDNRAATFHPGQFVRIRHVHQRLDSVLVIPRAAALDKDGRSIVFVVRGGVARMQPVELGMDLDGEVVVREGLLPGDTLVTLGQEYLQDSMPVSASTVTGGRP